MSRVYKISTLEIRGLHIFLISTVILVFLGLLLSFSGIILAADRDEKPGDKSLVMSETGEGLKYATIRNPGENLFVKNRDGTWVAAKDGMVILPGDEIRTLSKEEIKALVDGGKIGNIEGDSGDSFKVEEQGDAPSAGDKTSLVNLAVDKTVGKAENMKGQSSRSPAPVTQSTTARA